MTPPSSKILLRIRVSTYKHGGRIQNTKSGMHLVRFSLKLSTETGVSELFLSLVMPKLVTLVIFTLKFKSGGVAKQVSSMLLHRLFRYFCGDTGVEM